MKKTLLLFFLVAILGQTFAVSVKAVRRVPGSVPQTQPLQPLPRGIGANTNQNVRESKNQNSPSQPSLQTQETAGGANKPVDLAAPASPETAVQTTGTTNATRPTWIITLVFLLILIGTGYFLINKKNRQ